MLKNLYIFSALYILLFSYIKITDVDSPSSATIGTTSVEGKETLTTNDEPASIYMNLTHNKLRIRGHDWVRWSDKTLMKKFAELPISSQSQDVPECKLVMTRQGFSLYAPAVVYSTINCPGNRVNISNPEVMAALSAEILCHADYLQISGNLYFILNLVFGLLCVCFFVFMSCFRIFEGHWPSL